VTDQSQPTDHLGRGDKDFAIEFGGYLARAAERYLIAVNAWEDCDEGDARRALESAIYEFRKRAAKVKS